VDRRTVVTRDHVGSIPTSGAGTRGTGVRGLRHARLIHERAWFDSRVPHSMRGRLTAGRLALTQVIGVRNPASQSSRHHRLTDRPPGSQSGDRSSNLRGAITLGMWRSWQRARFGTARPHVRIVPSRLSESKSPRPASDVFLAARSVCTREDTVRLRTEALVSSGGHPIAGRGNAARGRSGLACAGDRASNRPGRIPRATRRWRCADVPGNSDDDRPGRSGRGSRG
jgi:hypothetical protein